MTIVNNTHQRFAAYRHAMKGRSPGVWVEEQKATLPQFDYDLIWELIKDGELTAEWAAAL